MCGNLHIFLLNFEVSSESSWTFEGGPNSCPLTSFLGSWWISTSSACIFSFSLASSSSTSACSYSCLTSCDIIKRLSSPPLGAFFPCSSMGFEPRSVTVSPSFCSLFSMLRFEAFQGVAGASLFGRRKSNASTNADQRIEKTRFKHGWRTCCWTSQGAFLGEDRGY